MRSPRSTKQQIRSPSRFPFMSSVGSPLPIKAVLSNLKHDHSRFDTRRSPTAIEKFILLSPLVVILQKPRIDLKCHNCFQFRKNVLWPILEVLGFNRIDLTPYTYKAPLAQSISVLLNIPWWTEERKGKHLHVWMPGKRLLLLSLNCS